MLSKILLLSLLLGLAPLALTAARGQSAVGKDAVTRAVDRLMATHGQGQAERIRLGVEQAAQRWWAEDGDEEAFVAFCEENFIADEATLDATFERLQRVTEQVAGRLHEIRRELTTPLDLDTGPVSKVDSLLANLDLWAHLPDDLYKTKVAFVALLNFPVHTLEERLARGASWDRETWARSRMMDGFSSRVPAAVQQEISEVSTKADQYIANYNVRLDRLVTADGERPFPEGLRLITHWGLRDELGSHYADATPAGLAKQRLIQKVMERIVRQEIPEAVIDNSDLLWDPFANTVKPVDGAKAGPSTEREPDTRYAHLLAVFQANRKADPFSPTAPTMIERRFELDRQIPEKEVEALLVSVLESKEARDLAGVIRQRLGRPLEPFDIWYTGFKPRGRYSEAELDRIVQAKYPTVAAFQAGLPDLLQKLGFAAERSRWLAERIVVDPSRGAGHALGAVRREDQAHLRTRVPQGGMNYKGYNIAVHELGHNVEQVFSLNAIDYWWLAGVPNNAFTEALAFVFQNRDLELLGLAEGGAEARRRAEALSTLWSTYEIGGVALVDMRVWRWMYEHPEATPAELRQATLAIAKDVWNRYYAPVFGVRDSDILAIYSHMIVYGLYLPDYPIGHVIAFQVAEKLHGEGFGAEFERVARQGRLTPDAWMRGAVGEPISARALLATAREAIAEMQRN